MLYRPEIDGLRALAISTVILFHFGIESITGGFLGVDIFFVISGYLITSIIIKDLEKERFTISDFYIRRIKRILPALIVVILTSYLIAFFTLAPGKVKDLSQELVAVATFSSNFYYLFTQNYFSSTAEETIFLHTWSLAVEEQFYIFFPLLLLFIRTLYQRLIVISFLTITSLFNAIYFSFNNPSFNFYFTPSRIWELMAGSLVAIHNPILANIDLKTRNLLSAIGLATIAVAVSVFVFTKETQHPSWPTIIPILAVCIVIGCSNGTSVATTIRLAEYLKRQTS